MGCSVIDPASAGCFQLCIFYGCGLDFEVSVYYIYNIVAVCRVVRSQYFRIGSYCLVCVCSSVGYGSEIPCFYQILFCSRKCRVRFIEELLRVMYPDRCGPGCNLDCCLIGYQGLITFTGTSCNHRYGSIGYIGDSRYCLRPGISSIRTVFDLILLQCCQNGIDDIQFYSVLISVIYPASSDNLKICLRVLRFFNLKVTAFYGYFVVCVVCVNCIQHLLIRSHTCCVIGSHIGYRSEIAVCYQFCYGSGKYRICLVKELLRIVYRDRCRLLCDLNGYVFGR